LCGYLRHVVFYYCTFHPHPVSLDETVEKGMKPVIPAKAGI
jgi:hypothetical protein